MINLTGSLVGSIALIVATSMPAMGQTLMERAREHDPTAGPLLITISGSTPTVTLSQLVAGVDVVVQGMVTSAQPELNEQQTAIFTVYHVQPLRELLNKTGGVIASPVRGGTFELRTLGGELELAGRTVRMHHSHFPQFEVGQQVVLFLKRTGKLDQYEIVAPPFGAIDVQYGHLIIRDPVRAAVLEEFNGADIDLLATRLQRLATQSPR